MSVPIEEDNVMHREGEAKPEESISNFVRLDPPPMHFGFDIDGTFNAEDEDAMRRNVETLEKVLKKGVNMFFCTGRLFCEALRVIKPELREKIGVTGYPGVYQNGAVVYGPNGKLLRSAHFRRDIVKRIIDEIVASKHEEYTIFLSQNKWYLLTTQMEYMVALRRKWSIQVAMEYATEEQVLANEITKIIVVDYDKVKHSFVDIDGKEFSSSCSLSNLTDLCPPGITKATGIELLLNEMGGTTEECGYIGDAENDIQAMQMIKHSFAVGNAHEVVKRAAKHVVRYTNEECAFSVVMEAVYGV